MTDGFTETEIEITCDVLKRLAARGKLRICLHEDGKVGLDVGDDWEVLTEDYLGREVRTTIDSVITAAGFVGEDGINDLKIYANLFTDLATMLINEIELAEVQLARSPTEKDE